MAEAIEQRFGIDTTLVKGRGGVFEVSLDGEEIFSKKSRGRFPEPGEVEDQVAARLGAV